MKFIAALATLVLAAVASGQTTMPTPFDCSTGSTQIAITSFDLSPYPLCINEMVCATGTGTLSTPVIEGATLAITGRYLGRLVYTDNHDLCELLASQGFACPMPTTMTSITACVLVKPNAPPNIGVALQVLAVNGDGGVLFCQAANGVIATTCP
ncbi:hypothetical protein EC957_009645 [Mortierella hygrophila]|uniref:Phosphatidylglycerol/phosphatidylinositol transfer protein n=1 Tax=Mortierella hygrophila TaxID=979708 RepID=A0A9P6K5A2_9FUNG|nr:hypothetical protein EC957_009645 [Mortierella hygrophila]